MLYTYTICNRNSFCKQMKFLVKLGCWICAKNEMISACQVLWMPKIVKKLEIKITEFSACTDIQFLSLQKCSAYKYYISEKFDAYRMTFVRHLLSVCTVPCIHVHICMCIVATICDRTSVMLNTQLIVACQNNANEHDSKLIFMIIQDRDVT